MQDKTLIILVTRNNYALLSNFITSLQKHEAGFDYDLIVADNSSTDIKHLTYLSKLPSKFKVVSCENDRVEATFDSVSKANIHLYNYFLFLHDDTFIFKDNWLKNYIDKLKTNYCEPAIKNAHYAHYRVGRVSACHQPYRDYNSCLGYPVQSFFLKKALEVYGQDVIIYKYSDIDRTLYTQECLKRTGIWSVKDFKKMQGTTLYENLVTSLNSTLNYPDEGIAPRDKYPAGEAFNKLTMLSEFFNSVWPLIEGFRTIGLEGDGYLEQVDGFDNPFGSNAICHYGAPHVKKFLAKKFSTTPEEIHKKLYENNLPFLLKCNTIMKEHFK